MRGTLTVICFCLFVSGCGRLETQYGQSSGYTANQSVNGFSAFRTSFVRAGFEDRNIRRLTDRVQRCDTIVWTPAYLSAIEEDVTEWFDAWLRQGNRTLIYVVPDSGSEGNYWIDAVGSAKPDQRLEYRRRAARSINERMDWRLSRFSPPSNGWFDIEPLVERTMIEGLDGQWADSIEQAAGDGGSKREIEFRIRPYDPNSAAPANSAATTGNPPAPNANRAVTNSGATGPGSTHWTFAGSATATSTEVRMKALLKDASGKTMIAQVTSDKWDESKIIVVAGGSLLTNYALIDPFSVAIVDKIVQSSLVEGDSDRRAGFISNPGVDLPVSDSQPGAPKVSGMEWLTTWPLSLISFHAALLGLVVLLMLLPSLGRPKRVRYNPTSDFGDHLDAVATLMSRSKGEAYARNRISEYMRRIHGETSGPWVQPDSRTTELATASTNKADPLNPSSVDRLKDGDPLTK